MHQPSPDRRTNRVAFRHPVHHRDDQGNLVIDRKPKNLSGGQRQRVAMGQAIVREPKVFCMDEPLSNLDAQLQQFDSPTELYDRPANLGRDGIRAGGPLLKPADEQPHAAKGHDKLVVGVRPGHLSDRRW